MPHFPSGQIGVSAGIRLSGAGVAIAITEINLLSGSKCWGFWAGKKRWEYGRRVRWIWVSVTRRIAQDEKSSFGGCLRFG